MSSFFKSFENIGKDPVENKINEMAAEQRRASYDQGFIDGVRCFAWWKDGVEYVGTTGMTLKEAIEQRAKLFGYGQ
jgi:hypothetical protein